MMNKLSRRLNKMIQLGYWPGFIIGMYPSQFAYKPIKVDFKKAWEHAEEVNLYFHMPFCKWSCSFCTFFKVVSKDEDLYHRYMDKVLEEIRFYSDIFSRPVGAKSICFGGGTPNVIAVSDYERLFNALEKSNFQFDKDLEPSMEISPEIISEDYIAGLASVGIKRLSLGVQSLVGELRKGVNREKTLNILRIVDSIRKYNLNINIDLINGIRGQDFHSFMETLREIVKFAPETISIYPISGQANSMFRKSEQQMTTRDKYELWDIYHDYLASNGYDCESHVKWIKKNQHSTHQQKIYEYKGVETLGIGCGARSYNNLVHYGTSSWNDQKLVKRAIEDYMTKDYHDLSWYGFEMNLDENRRRSIIYAWFLGYLDLADYRLKYHSHPIHDYPDEFEALSDNGLIDVTDTFITLTRKGRKYTDLCGTLFWSETISKMFHDVHYANG